jgi:hypothetical protein
VKRLALIALFFVLVPGCVYALLRFLTCIVFNTDKAWNIALMIDQTANVGANGQVDTTISARAARARNAGKGWGCVLCRVLNVFQKNHCDIALGDVAKT